MTTEKYIVSSLFYSLLIIVQDNLLRINIS